MSTAADHGPRADRASGPGTTAQLLSLLTEHLEMAVDPGSLTAATTFESLGMNSLTLMELVVAAEQECGLVLREDALDDLSPAMTLGTAADAFEHAV